MKSVKAIHPELPAEVIRVEAPDPIKGLLEKSRMLELSPFEETLFLDADTVVLGRLDFAFQKAEQFGLACAICECPWAKRYAGIDGDLIEYNTGVLFFTRKAKPIFERWNRLSSQVDSSIKFYDNERRLITMPYNDQAAFSLAIDESKFNPFVLPLNWNFRPLWQRSFFGPIKVWHNYADVPAFFHDANKYYGQADSIIQYHEARG